MSPIKITAFIEHCKIQKGLSDHSLRAYHQDLTAFDRFRQAQVSSGEVLPSSILAFTNHMREIQRQSPATLRRRIVTLKSYFVWLKEIGDAECSPFDGLTLELKVPKRLPRPVDRPTLSHLFRSARRIAPVIADPILVPEEIAIDYRQVTGLVARLLVSTGLRVGEITRVRIYDVSSAGACIRVHGKGDRERTVYVGNANLLRDLNAYLELRRARAHSNDYLFLNSRGARLTEPAFRKRLRNMSRDLKITPHLTPHRFRHSAATMLIEEGVDIRLVQRLLGHASVATTEIYTKVSDNTLISAIERADTLSKVDS